MKQKSNLYTQFILTVIAIFLGAIVFQNISLVEKANAASTPASQSKEVIDVNIVEVNGYQIYGENVPVRER